MQKHYEQPYRLDGETRLVIHYENDFGGVVTNREGHLLLFSTAGELQAYAQKKKIKLRGEHPLMDFDAALAWVESPVGDPDCRALRACWGFLGDVARSVGEAESFPGYDRRVEYLHEELLWGCNLETPWGGEAYVPEFGSLDLERLREVLEGGLALLRQWGRPC